MGESVGRQSAPAAPTSIAGETPLRRQHQGFLGVKLHFKHAEKNLPLRDLGLLWPIVPTKLRKVSRALNFAQQVSSSWKRCLNLELERMKRC